MPDDIADRRAYERRRCLKGARIIFNNRSSSIDCIVRNTSPGGVKLSLETAASIPDEFSIRFPDGREQRCIVRWRRLSELGVEFLNL